MGKESVSENSNEDNKVNNKNRQYIIDGYIITQLSFSIS